MVGVSHTRQTLASGKRQHPPGIVLANPTLKIVRTSHNGTSDGNVMAPGRDFGTAGIGDRRGNGKLWEHGDDGQDLQHMG